MKCHRHVWLAAVSLTAGLLVLSSCVWRTEHKIETVHHIDAHIVLDIRQEASQIEDFVRETPANSEAAEGKPVSCLALRGGGVELAGQGSRAWFNVATTAWAADALAKVSPEDEKAAKERRRERFPSINAALKAGTLGEGNRGYVSPLGGATEETKKLAKAENADRETIYRAVAGRKGLDESQLKLIEALFAEEIRKGLPAGQQFQAPAAGTNFEKFKNSELGKRYPDAKPGQWLKK